MQIPESLKAKIELFRSQGRIIREWDVLFAEESWLQVMPGQGIRPEDNDPLVDHARSKRCRDISPISRPSSRNVSP